MNTPWGRSDSQKRIIDGVIEVSTPSHGGLLVRKDFAEKRLSESARKRGMNFGEYLAYEEDCDWAIPVMELPEIWGEYFKHAPEEIKKDPRTCLVQALSRYNSEYLLERGIEPDQERYKEYLLRQKADELRKEKNPDFIVAARGSWHTGINGVTEVTTADGKEHLVVAESYRKLNQPLLLLSNCVLYKPEQDSAIGLLEKIEIKIKSLFGKGTIFVEVTFKDHTVRKASIPFVGSPHAAGSLEDSVTTYVKSKVPNVLSVKVLGTDKS